MSREAEIAARLKDLSDSSFVTHVRSGASLVADCSYLLAQLQQARGPKPLSSCLHAFGEWCNACVGGMVDEFNRTRQELQQARQERDEAKASEQRQYDQSVEATVEMLQLRAALQQAREALKKYGQHKSTCLRITNVEQQTTSCTCGLDAALKAVR